ncbi:MAG: RuvA [uncultured Thermomicrobiales bacterium]|uniref:Holliday junction branch migration complex subunit RuvA n=1 Tax=uncultured Thermomicrobiales bacterium TaxID=1645740 RepID=A0A6J4V7Q8_9BACT|nr:MAG: RuvA [uncultured Thermomicrobiales bacterium]
MIAGLRGTVAAKLADALLVDVGGVVYRVGTSATTLDAVGGEGNPVRLHTFLFVRQDQLTLYGFAGPEELRLFETLIGVAGVGPRLACAILSRVRVDALHDAILREDADLLATVPGVGKKTAARLILELRGKLVPAGPLPAAGSAAHADSEVIEALQALGYTAAEAHAAATLLPRDGAMTAEERVVAALRELARA